jgi:ankyrin repeat protein
MVKYLVDKGANVDFRSTLVGSVSDVLAENLGDWDDRMDMVRYMVTKFDDTTFKRVATSRAFDGGHLDVFRMLVQEFDADISSTQDELVSRAVIRNEVDMLEFLLVECRANTTFLHAGHSPLSIAIHMDHRPIIWLMIEHGVDVYLYGTVNIMIAALRTNLPLIKYFVRKGIQVNCDSVVHGTIHDILTRNGVEPSFLDYIRVREHCGNPGCLGGGKKRCALCEDVRYCSKECQTTNWFATHQRECSRAPE